MVNVLRRKGTGAGGSQSRGNADVSSHFVCDQLRKSSIGQGRWSEKVRKGRQLICTTSCSVPSCRPWLDDILPAGFRDRYLAVMALLVGYALGDGIRLACNAVAAIPNMWIDGRCSRPLLPDGG